MEALESKRKKSEKIYIQERDIAIFEFLNRVGYANLVQVTKFVTDTDDEKTQNAIMRRLYLLRRFDYIKTFNTQMGVYYALTSKSKLSNQLISGVRFDQLPHHNFLLSLFYEVKHCDVLTEREVLAKYKVIGKKGKIPDMLINDWVIEYERTNKNNVDCKAVLDYWVLENSKKICIIYEQDEIRNRYERLITNPAKVALLSSRDYKNILNVLKEHDTGVSQPPYRGENEFSASTTMSDVPNGTNGGLDNIANKYK
jgi:hypothetical protein